MKQALRYIVIAACLAAATTACNTLRGLGADIKAAGGAIERAGN